VAIPDWGNRLDFTGEPIILFYWDGAATLVTDVDYVYAGPTSPNNPFVNKSGVTVEGPAGRATYLGETGDSYTSGLRHAPLSTVDGGLVGTCRRAGLSEGNQIATGSNGIGGRDETSEESSKTWVACNALSPTAPAGPDAGPLELDAAAPGLDAAVVAEDASPASADAHVVPNPDAHVDAQVASGPDAHVASGADGATSSKDAGNQADGGGSDSGGGCSSSGMGASGLAGSAVLGALGFALLPRRRRSA
jgi:hypothetical protein